MKKFLALLISFLGLLALVLAVPSKASAVSADTGPKPTTQITIKNLEKSDYIVAFGMDTEFYGPHRAFTPAEDREYINKEELTQVYNVVNLPEGWYLCDISCSYTGVTEIVVNSGYMWPSDFILILLNKSNNQYYLSEETKTYAFNSYFECDMANYQNGSIALSKPITLDAKYQYGKEIGEFFLRLAVTLGIELLLALAFKFTKKSFIVIAITNAITQVGLNVALNLTAHFNGKNPWLAFIYAFVEIAIVVVEALVFMKFCERKDGKSKLPILLYTVAANILSFGLGMLLWFII